MRSSPIGVLFALVTLTSGAHAQRLLDLTQPRPSDSAPLGEIVTSVARGGPIVEGEPRVRLPLDVTLTSVNRRDYFLGEPVVFEITVANMGTSELQLPWSPDRPWATSGDRPSEASERRMRLALVVVDDTGWQHSLAGVTLYGSAEVSDSLATLLPGATATVRAPGWLKPVSASGPSARFLSALPNVMPLRAMLRITTAQGRSPEPVLSSNAIPVSLSFRPSGKP